MVTADRPQFGLESEALKQTVARLNGHFRDGGSAFEKGTLSLLRSLRNPIILYPYNVVINSKEPLVPNLGARDFIGELRKIGTVIYFSFSRGTLVSCQQTLERLGLWHEDTVLMTLDNLSIDSIPDEADISKWLVDQWRIDLNDPECDPRIYPDKNFPLLFNTRDIPVVSARNLSSVVNGDVQSVRIKPFAPFPHELGKRFFVRRGGVSLEEAVELVRRRRFINAPFKSRLVDGFGDLIKLSSINPDLVVRLSGPEEQTLNYSRENLQNFRKTLRELSRIYHIAVPAHLIVFGPDNNIPRKKSTYVIVEKIMGDNLEKKEYAPVEVEHATGQLNVFYSAIAEYLWDKYENGGIFFQDLISPQAKNRQFVYGRRKGESEDRVWLVDLDPIIWVISPKERELLTDYFPTLIKMIKQSEEKLGVRLEDARAKILQVLHPIRDSWDGLQIRRELADPTAGTLEQDEIEVTEKMSSYRQQVMELDISADEWSETAKNFFDGWREALKKALLKIEQSPEDKDAAEKYSLFVRERFAEAVYQTLKEKFVRVIGEDEVLVLEYRYSHQLVEAKTREILKPRYEEIAAKYDEIEFERVAKEANKKMVVELGWEEDILPHLAVIYNVICEGQVELADHYLSLAIAQLGWDFHFPFSAQDVQRMSEESLPKSGWDDDIKSFAQQFLRKNINEQLSAKLQEAEEKYGIEARVFLVELFFQREFERIFS